MGETIFAQATARGRAGVAVVRVSGPKALEAVALLAGGIAPDRTATVRWLSDPRSGERLDQALLLGFAGPHSFTGEDVAELQLHGSPAAVGGVLDALGAVEGLRLAEPGEFTRRALLNGRLDLSQVEGLGDLLAAETAGQRRQAVAVMGGALGRLAAAWGWSADPGAGLCRGDDRLRRRGIAGPAARRGSPGPLGNPRGDAA